MMSEPLKIPKTAYAAGYYVCKNYGIKITVADSVINAAAPLIAAAELRHLANRSINGKIRRLLRNRANELDPEGGNADPA
jgi:hypothetical protein